jgi:hypothetical protein
MSRVFELPENVRHSKTDPGICRSTFRSFGRTVKDYSYQVNLQGYFFSKAGIYLPAGRKAGASPIIRHNRSRNIEIAEVNKD